MFAIDGIVMRNGVLLVTNSTESERQIDGLTKSLADSSHQQTN